MEKQVVPELLQKSMKPKLIFNKLVKLFDDKSEERDTMLIDYEKLRTSLGSPGVYNRIAESILNRTTQSNDKITSL